MEPARAVKGGKVIDTKGSRKLQAKLSEIVIRPRMQVRAGTNDGALEDYERAYRDGVDMPPVLLYPDQGDLVLVDGFHRYYAAQAAGLETISARVLRPHTPDQGDDEAASLALAANRQHGLRLAPADRRRAIELALEHPWFEDATNARIAEVVGCSAQYVGRVRRELEDAQDAQDAQEPEERDDEPPPLPEEDDAPEPARERPGPAEPEPEPEPKTGDREIDALREAAMLVRQAHKRIVDLHQSTGVPVLKDAFLVLNTARSQIAQELQAREGEIE